MFKPERYDAGSIHQGDEMFSDISRGRQCSFMSFSALLCAQIYSPQHWRCCIIDQLLNEDDKLNVTALGNGEIPNAETMSVNCLPNQIYWPFNSLIHTTPPTNNTSHVTNEPIAIVGTNTDQLMLVDA